MKGRNAKLPRRGIYLLPATFTVANVFCGFYSIISSIRGELALAGILIGLGILLDTLDGRVARFANASSDFGKEFDSLADQTSFGIAPMVLAHEWGMSLWPRMGWLIGFLFVICGAMRLARFNIQPSSTDKRFFIGLPIPAAAAVIAVDRLSLSGAHDVALASAAVARARARTIASDGEQDALLQLQGF